MAPSFYRCPRCGQTHPSEVRICPRDVARPSPAQGTRAQRPRDPDDTQEIDLGPLRAAARAADAGETTTSVASAGLMGATVGGYQVKQLIGEGGMASVYEAVRVSDGMRVALKVLATRGEQDRASLDRFRQEARVAGSLLHPNIVRFVGTGFLPDGTPYLALEYLDGETLGQRLSRDRFLPLEDALSALRQILAALSAAHERGIVHRDLNPENVFLVGASGASPPAIKLLDFGLAKTALPRRASETQVTLTQAGYVVGTPVYMAPEQAGGDRDIDARADLYAAGVLGYQMLIGRTPYKAQQPVALLVEMNARAPVMPRVVRPAIPEWLERAVMKLIALERDARFQSARDALKALGG